MILEAYKQEIVSLIEEAHCNGARYSKGCEVVGISIRTLQRWKKGDMKDKRKGALKRVVRKLPPEARQEIVSICTEKRFYDNSPHEIVPMLLDESIYIASTRTFYRVLRENNLMHHRSNNRVSVNSHKPPEKQATASNQLWCWDITWMPQTVKGLFFYAYVITDIYDKSIVGWSVHLEENDIHSKDLFKRTLCGRDIRLLSIHSDNGGPMKGITLLSFLEEMKVSASFSRPRVSNDNPFIESLFKTLKYSTKYPLRFRDIEHVREWMAEFVLWYNTEHLHSSIGYVTPEQMRTGKADEIFNKRNDVMEAAKIQHSERWGSRKPKVWRSAEKVVLNRNRIV